MRVIGWLLWLLGVYSAFRFIRARRLERLKAHLTTYPGYHGLKDSQSDHDWLWA